MNHTATIRAGVLGLGLICFPGIHAGLRNEVVGGLKESGSLSKMYCPRYESRSVPVKAALGGRRTCSHPDGHLHQVAILDTLICHEVLY
jgi:hypothetical protein